MTLFEKVLVEERVLGDNTTGALPAHRTRGNLVASYSDMTAPRHIFTHSPLQNSIGQGYP